MWAGGLEGLFLNTMLFRTVGRRLSLRILYKERRIFTRLL